MPIWVYLWRYVADARKDISVIEREYLGVRRFRTDPCENHEFCGKPEEFRFFTTWVKGSQDLPVRRASPLIATPNDSAFLSGPTRWIC